MGIVFLYDSFLNSVLLFFIYFIIEKKNSCINIHTLRDFCWVLPSSAIRLESSSKADSSLHEDTPDEVWLRIVFFPFIFLEKKKYHSQNF